MALATLWKTILAVGVMGVLTTLSTLAQDESPSEERHPLIGSWDVSITEGDAKEHLLISFFADGNALATSESGAQWHGHWEAAGERAGRFILVAIGQETPEGTGIARIGDFEVDTSGDNLSRPADAPRDGSILVDGRRIQISR